MESTDDTQDDDTRETAPPPRVLVVDDNEVSRRVAVEALKQLDLAAAEASNGREAVEAARQTAYDLVLMDCTMPEMDGFEAARQIRENESGGPHRAHIVAVTGSVSYNDEQRCFDAGMNAYVPKPIRARQLKAILDGLTRSEA
jgi:CheY-like chemotaxis protein